MKISQGLQNCPSGQRKALFKESLFFKRKVGKVGQVGLVWFGRKWEAEFKTINELISKVGIELLGQLKMT